MNKSPDFWGFFIFSLQPTFLNSLFRKENQVNTYNDDYHRHGVGGWSKGFHGIGDEQPMDKLCQRGDQGDDKKFFFLLRVVLLHIEAIVHRILPPNV